jgi:hypothetical protein
MSDWQHDDWDPAEEKRALSRKIRSLGMEPTGFYGLLRFELALFEARLDVWARRRYADTGSAVPDWSRQKHRSMFGALLERKYGTRNMDPEVEAKLPPLSEDDFANIKRRAEREFEMGSPNRGGPSPETLQTLRELGLARKES